MSSVSSATNSNAAYYAAQQRLFSKLDSDENGTLSKDEFVAGRPKEVSEEQASTLYAKIDSSNSGALTEDQLSQGMEDNRSSTSPESQVSPEVMAVLMQLQQQGGMMSSGGAATSEEVYDALDTNQDGAVSQAEFLAGKPEGMSDEEAQALYDSIDTEGTGSITEEQLASSMPAGPAGPPVAGGPASSEEAYDALDTDQNGTVSQAEFLAAKPDDVSTEDATALFASLDSESTGSITLEQFSAFMDSSRPAMGMSEVATDISSLLDLLDTASSSAEDATVSA